MKRINRFIFFPIAALIIYVSCQNDSNIIDEVGANNFQSSFNILDVTFCSATISGTVSIENADLSELEYGILLSSSSEAYVINSNKYPIETLLDDNSFSITVTGLDPIKTYYFRSYICRDGEFIFGDINSFTTKTVDDIIKTMVVEGDTCLITTTIESKSLIDIIDSCGVCYDLVNDIAIDNKNTIHTVLVGNSFSLELTNLHYGITYYCVYVKISNQVFYSSTNTIVKKMITSDAIDLGLSVKWATFNVGATKPNENGFYYSWGEIEPRDEYNCNDYKWAAGYKTGKNKLDLEDDVAHAQWGEDWRMPTKEEMLELELNCDRQYTVIDNKRGFLFTSKIEGFTESSIFFPMTGVYDNQLYYNDDYCLYLTSDCDVEERKGIFCGMSDYQLYFGTVVGDHGLQIRPVSPSDRYEGIDATSLTIDEDTITVYLEDIYPLSFNIKRGDVIISRPLVWTTSDSTVAIVNEMGEIAGLKKGTAVITVSYHDIKDSCIVNVTGFESVNLGLSVRWATCNIGADNPWEYGDYFAWGETETKESYDLMTYKWFAGAIYYYKMDIWYRKLTKYCSISYYSYYGQCDNKTRLDNEDDVSNVLGGNRWRTPTESDFQELISKCSWRWTTMNNVSGYLITSKINGNSIFLPAAGEKTETELFNQESSCLYWSRNRYMNEADDFFSIILYAYPTGVGTQGSFRWGGLPIRPVKYI